MHIAIRETDVVQECVGVVANATEKCRELQQVIARCGMPSGNAHRSGRIIFQPGDHVTQFDRIVVLFTVDIQQYAVGRLEP